MKPTIQLIFLWAVLLALPAAVGADDLTFLTHNVEGNTYRDAKGALRGKAHAGRRAFNVELVRAMMIQVGHPVQFEILPFKRAYNLIVQSKKPYALFNLGRRAFREGKMKWVGPLQTDTILFWENSQRPTGIRSLEDAKAVEQICVIIGSSHYKEMAQAGFENLHQNVDYKSCFKMLAKGRIDLTVISHHSIRGILQQADIPDGLIQSTGVILEETKGYMAFSNSVPDSVVRQWQQALEQIKQSGQYDQLARNYLYK